MAGLLARVGEKVQEYFARAQSVICKETVRVQSLGADLLGDGSHARQVVSDLRIAWQPAPDADRGAEANVLREVVSVNGRPPRAEDEPRLPGSQAGVPRAAGDAVAEPAAQLRSSNGPVSAAWTAARRRWSTIDRSSLDRSR